MPASLSTKLSLLIIFPLSSAVVFSAYAEIVDCNGVITNKPCPNGKKIAEEYIPPPLTDEEKSKAADRQAIRNAWLKNILSATATPKPAPTLPPATPTSVPPTAVSNTVINLIQDSNNIIVHDPGRGARVGDSYVEYGPPPSHGGHVHSNECNSRHHTTEPTPKPGRAQLPQ